MPNISFSPQNISQIRADTPGVSRAVHFNNAGASLMPDVVAQKVIEYLTHELHYGGYETALKYSTEIESAYVRLAKYLNCHPSELALTENATAAWDQAFLSIPFEPGDTILTSTSEYASNYIPFLQLKNRTGVNIKAIPCDQYGQVNLSALTEMLDKTVKLIAITHVPTNGGLVNPAAEIGKIARENNIFYLLDACQSVGQMPMDVEELGCDFLSATSRKFLRGPRGVGFLYASQQRTSGLEPAILDLHGAEWTSQDTYCSRIDARKYENWESNLAGIVGFSVAVEYMLNIGVDLIWKRIQYLAEYLREKLGSIPAIEVQDLGVIKCGIVSFSSPMEAEQLKTKLHQARFNVSVIHPGHTLLDMNKRGLGHLIRASVHYYNTEQEIEWFAEKLEVIINEK